MNTDKHRIVRCKSIESPLGFAVSPLIKGGTEGGIFLSIPFIPGSEP